MLVLTRKPGEKIVVDNQYNIEISAVERGVVKLLFDINQPVTLMPGNIELEVPGSSIALTRKVDDSVIFGESSAQIEILIVSVKGEAVRIGVKAPREVTVHREEVWRLIRESNIAASQATELDPEQIQELLKKQPGTKLID